MIPERMLFDKRIGDLKFGDVIEDFENRYTPHLIFSYMEISFAVFQELLGGTNMIMMPNNSAVFIGFEDGFANALCEWDGKFFLAKVKSV